MLQSNLQEKYLKAYLAKTGNNFYLTICSQVRKGLTRNPSTSVSIPPIDDIRDSPFDDLRDSSKWLTADLALVDIPVTIWISSKTLWKAKAS